MNKAALKRAVRDLEIVSVRGVVYVSRDAVLAAIDEAAEEGDAKQQQTELARPASAGRDSGKADPSR